MKVQMLHWVVRDCTAVAAHLSTPHHTQLEEAKLSVRLVLPSALHGHVIACFFSGHANKSTRHTQSYSIQNIKRHIPLNFTSFNHVELPRFQKRALMSTKNTLRRSEMGNRRYDTNNRHYKALIWDYHYTELKPSNINYNNLVMTIIHSCIQNNTKQK